MTKTTNKQRIKQYDAVKVQSDKLELAVHDLVNHRFSIGERLRFADYQQRVTDVLASDATVPGTLHAQRPNRGLD